MATMSIAVSDPLDKWIEAEVESGRYASASDYVHALIRQDREIARQGQLSVDDIRRMIESNIDEGTVPADEVFDRLERKFRSSTYGT